MNRHQILTGAVNAGDSCSSVGSVEGVHFTAYAAGCDLVILASDFQRVQIIPGATHGNIQVRCVDCSSDTGKIAASYGSQVLIFEPTPLLHHKSTHKLDYQWYQTATLDCKNHVNALSWNLEGTRLLVGGTSIQLWQSPEENDAISTNDSRVGFTLGHPDSSDPEWDLLWNCETASSVYHLRFSPDGLLFASASKCDRLVKVWYENKKSQMLRGTIYEDADMEEALDYSFCYIAHPQPVTDFSWRRISKYMPRGTVTNVLMTWSKDNICRLWSETVLPDDGLVDVQQFDLKQFQDPKLRATRHKKRFVHKLSHIRHAMHKRRKHKKEGRSQGLRVAALSSSESTHDFHKYWMQQNGLTPVLHFHLAAAINPASDIPLGPSANSSFDNGFVVHWLNNKELQFTIESEKLMNDINRRTIGADDDTESVATEISQPTEKKKRNFWNRISSHSKLSSIDSDSDMQSDHTMVGSSSQSAISLDTWSHKTQSSFTGTILEDVPSQTALKLAIDDTFDRSIERMLKDWHNSPDILFSIHPTDGSLLVWSIDYLDEIEPGSFRQAQVTFSSRLPHVFPLGDAMSMSANVLTYSANDPLDVLQGPSAASESCCPTVNNNNAAIGQFNLLPHVYMLSKHLNGSLNLWKANFSENSKFRTCVNVSHTARACGHRFRTNTASSHPVLPLLITTSHHNLPNKPAHFKPGGAHTPSDKPKAFDPATGLSSELILWRVDSIGPLSLAGGLTELAKVNSPNVSAFDNVAWLPTLLPSSALGSSANSSSSLFVASDGGSMRLYQAVIDARGLLSSDTAQAHNNRNTLSPSSSNSSFKAHDTEDQFDGYNIVSEQSTSRPGCIIELEALQAAQHEWTNTQLLHVYQGQLVTGKEAQHHNDGAFVDLRNQESFQEKFYLVVLEHSALEQQSYLHMWQIVISSSEDGRKEESKKTLSPEIEDGMDSDTSSEPRFDHKSAGPQFKIDTSKVYSRRLHLPDGVKVLHATAAAGHLSSSTIYPACLAPYVFSTACSDGSVRFWACRAQANVYTWSEWKMPGLGSSLLKVPGRPISVSCAFTGRMAVAYRRGEIMAAKDNPSNKYVNLYVSIYECESTGGSEWVQEDTIELKNIFIPDPKAEIDLSCILGTERKISHVLSSENFFKMQLGSHHQPSYGHQPPLHSQHSVSPSSSFAKLPHVPSIPSLSTIQSVKKCIAQTGNKTGVLQQKHLVQLDWAPTEDGSHILTVAVGSRILFFSPVSNDIAENAAPDPSIDMPSSGHPNRPTLQKSLSISVPHTKPSSFSWMKLRSLELSTADGLPPLPMHVSWAKDGVLIVGMDNEMHVYSQWYGPHSYNDISGLSHLHAPSCANLKAASTVAADLLNYNSSSSKLSTLRISSSVPHFHRMMASKIGEKREKKEMLRKNSVAKVDSEPPLVAMLEECGLFEAVQITNPVLPQYHPKQLLELLNFGKVKRVKAILAHLMHCITNNAKESGLEDVLFRPRAMSVHQVAQSKGKVQVSEEMTSFVDISSIPPLPLYCLLAADNDQPISMVADTTIKAEKESYNELFTDGYNPSHDDLDLHLTDDDEDEADSAFSAKGRESAHSQARSRFMFGPKESDIFSKALTHVSLPGLTNLDQMYLMALSNTVANTQTDFSDRFTDGKQSIGAMDDCGLRYVLAVGHDTYLMKTLSPALRLHFQQNGFSFSDIIWGFHSESEEEIVNTLPSFSKGEPSWEEARMFGVGWIVTNINVLRRTVEKIAKSSFQKSKDPMDSAIFYLAMKKKMILWGLYRSVSNEKMQKFFKNDFTQERWRKAALKNAYQLLGLQRFLHAAAFFLLAGSLKDAVDICINRLNDLQLAIVISKLHTSDLGESALSPAVQEILDQEVLGGAEHDEDLSHPDAFLRSMALWMCKQYKKSLSTLLTRDIGIGHPAYKQYLTQDNVSVFNFYNYLRTHPLLLRQKLASQADSKGMRAAAVLSGFSHAASESDKVVSVNEKITPAERSLYFHTAHEHFKAGCPALALEVLTKLPQMADMSQPKEDDEEENEEENKKNKEPALTNGVASSDSIDWAAPVSSQKSTNMDWGAPVSTQTSNSMDWGAPASSMDWGAPIGDPYSGLNNRMKEEEPPSFSVLSSDDDSDSSDEGGLVMKKIKDSSDEEEVATTEQKPAVRPSNLLAPPSINRPGSSDEEVEDEQPQVMFDIMAQQLKFIACLKVAMEELATLATGFEVEGGQLRYQLYIWLEKQTEVLKMLCNYCETLEEVQNEPVIRRPSIAPSITDSDKYDRLSVGDDPQGKSAHGSAQSTPHLGHRANLHEVITADRLDFEAKQLRMARRKQWLRRNQQLLRTLLTYCSLYGASGGGLACIKMELILLLQELQQDRTQKQLLSPLPFPTTLPLLSASIASSKTVTVDPISYLQSFIQEMLSTILSVQKVPDYTGNLHLVVTLRNLSTALSSCIYECLCDSDSIVVGKVNNDVGLEGFTNISTSVVYKDSCLMAGARSKHQIHQSKEDEFPQTQPSKWPGATPLTAMLMRERDSDAPKLPLLLCESLFSVYLSVLIHALTFYETNVLYRLVAHELKEDMWSTLFGGGLKTIVKPRTTSGSECAQAPTPNADMDKHRANLVRKVVQGPTSSPVPARPANKPTYQEKFVPPKMSMVNYLFSKPHKTLASCGIDYDSDDPDEDEEPKTYDDGEETIEENEEHMDPHSYSWYLMRLAVIKHVLHSLNRFLALVGFEPSDLPSCSSLLHSLLRNLQCWENQLISEIDKLPAPNGDYIHGLYKESVATGPSINKYRTMLKPDNTPFRSSQHSALPCRRLWLFLVNQPHLHSLFIKYLFGKRRKFVRTGSEMLDPHKFDVKVIYKDSEAINACCLSTCTESTIAAATHKELVELDISALLHPPVWMDDDSDDDSDDGSKGSEFVYIADRKSEFQIASGMSSASLTGALQTGHGTNMTMKHPFADVKRMGAHPIFPYYLAGSNDGAVRIYEFGHSQPIQEPIAAGTTPRPTKIQFNAQGNKFGVTDMEGYLSLFQVGFGTNTTTSYMRMPCHNKSANDFVFIGSSSFLATVGHSSDGKNVAMWDTLLPSRCSLIQSFHCHEYGGTSLLYAPQHQLLVAGGKKGDVCIFDVRQRKQLHTFTVHESSVRCMALDPCEEFFVTGSAEGDIKVWGLSMHQLIKTYQGEHSRASMFSRAPTAGVLQLHVTNDGHLYSAGADGTLKVRLIPDENHSSSGATYHEYANAQANKSVTFSLT